MENIEQHIKKDKEILDNPTISPQQRRHTQQELIDLKSYAKRHPEDHHDPTPLEIFCDTHPDAEECRIYEI